MPVTEYDTTSGKPLHEGAEPSAPEPRAEAAQPSFVTLSVSAVVGSRTNPRTRYDAAKLEELSQSIQASGVLQPILVRPLPADRLQETFTNRPKGALLPTHEIVAGERRWRASQLANVATIPAIVRHLTDAQVLEMQIVENLQREDLHPMEEAEGYERLCEVTSIKKEDIGGKIGRSRAYVYGRLKLLDLIPQARKAFYDAEIDATRALVIARIPDTALQIKALEYATHKDFYGAVRSSRDFQTWAQQNVMLKLSAARFKITDASLVPDAGSCRECPKRTGAAPDLFADVSADVCTDPKCFHQKEEAHNAALLAKAKDRGLDVIEGKEAKAVWPSPYRSEDLVGYVRLDKADPRTPGNKALKTVLGKDAPEPTLLISPHGNGEIVEVLPADTVRELLTDKGYITPQKAAAEKRADSDAGKREAKLKAATKFEKAWRRKAIEAAWVRLQEPGTEGLSYSVIRLAALRMVTDLSADERSHIGKLLEVGTVGQADGLRDHIKTCDDLQVEAVLQLLMMERDVKHLYSYYNDKPEPTPNIDAVATSLEIDLAAIKNEVKAETRAAAPKPPTPKASAALEKKGGAAEAEEGEGLAAPDGAQPRLKPAAKRKGKLSPEEASSGIAAAMQSVEGEPSCGVSLQVGTKVRVRDSVTQLFGKAHRGREGTVRVVEPDGVLQVCLPGKRGKVADFCTFRPEDLEVIE